MAVVKVEDQMYRFLLDKEAERYEEEKRSLAEQGSKKKARRKPVWKPWSRKDRLELCQDSDLLFMVREYDYDLTDQHFQEYCQTRGILHLAGEIGSKRWTMFVNHQTDKNSFLSDEYFQHATPVNDNQYKFTANEMESQWTVILIGRARFQDCWETFANG